MAVTTLVPDEAHSITCIAGPFIVFFDRDKDTIAADKQAILDDVAKAYGTCGGGRILVAGHTDRSGSSIYNLSLSRRRADRIRAYLVQRGLPAEVIETHAFGEAQPLFDGEAQNRRVEIVFGP